MRNRTTDRTVQRDSLATCQVKLGVRPETAAPAHTAECAVRVPAYFTSPRNVLRIYWRSRLLPIAADCIRGRYAQTFAARCGDRFQSCAASSEVSAISICSQKHRGPARHLHSLHERIHIVIRREFGSMHDHGIPAGADLERPRCLVERPKDSRFLIETRGVGDDLPAHDGRAFALFNHSFTACFRSIASAFGQLRHFRPA